MVITVDPITDAGRPCQGHICFQDSLIFLGLHMNTGYYYAKNISCRVSALLRLNKGAYNCTFISSSLQYHDKMKQCTP